MSPKRVLLATTKIADWQITTRIYSAPDWISSPPLIVVSFESVLCPIGVSPSKMDVKEIGNMYLTRLRSFKWVDIKKVDEVRFGYYFFGKNGKMVNKWVWGQFLGMVALKDFKRQIEKAKKKGWIGHCAILVI